MSEQLPEALLDLHKWDRLSRAECVRIAFQVEPLLPPSFRFTKLKTYASASEQHHVAYFQWTAPPGPSLTHADLQIDPNYPYRALTRHLDAHEDLLALPGQKREKIQKKIEELAQWRRPTFSRKQYATTFALIPGGTVTLGYDREQRLIPSDELLYEAEEAGFMALGEKVMVKARNGTPEWKATRPHDQELADYLGDRLLPRRTVRLRPFLLEQAYMGIGDFIDILGLYSEDMLGIHSLSDDSNYSVTHRLVTGLLEKQGFRLPTSDEWEYCCMAGRKKLFFWEESSRPLDYYPEFPQNTFGLKIADYSYNVELCVEPGILRGGDGGETQCGWAGRFAHYLTLTSAYYCAYDPVREVSAYFRRAYSL